MRRPRIATDGDGVPVRAGSVIIFNYGIPPVYVEAKVVIRRGKLVALAPDHNPKQWPLRLLSRYVEWRVK